jgi:hypothetical protein
MRGQQQAPASTPARWSPRCGALAGQHERARRLRRGLAGLAQASSASAVCCVASASCASSHQ